MMAQRGRFIYYIHVDLEEAYYYYPSISNGQSYTYNISSFGRVKTELIN
jgi:hypothetical protein